MPNKKKKDKVLKTKVKDAKFIRFTEIQKKYLDEVRVRTVNEFNAAVDAVCEELGITEKLKQAPPGMYKLRMSDLGGLDVLPPPPPVQDPPPDPPLPDPPKDPPPPGGKPEDQLKSGEKGGKDN